MSTFRAALAIGEDGMAAVAAAWADLGPLPAGANLGILYLTEEAGPAFGPALRQLRRDSGIERWIGGIGLGVCGADAEVIDRPAASVMVGALPDDGFRTFRMDDPASGLAGIDPAWIAGATPSLGLVHGDPRDRQIVDLVEGVAAGSGAFMVGGLMSTSAAAVHAAPDPRQGGVSGALFAADVALATGLTQGCQPIGPHRRVTEAQDNLVITLDDRPAFEVLLEDIGPELAADPRRLGGRIFVAFPVRGSDRADYLVRNLVGFDPDNKVIAVAAPVAPGDTLFFCARDRESASHDLDRMLVDLKGRAGGAPKGAIYCTCIARGPNLFGPDAAELRAIRRALGDVPIAGVFCNGEIFHARFYGYTGVLTLFL